MSILYVVLVSSWFFSGNPHPSTTLDRRCRRLDVIVDVIVAALAPGLDGLSFETVSPAAECFENLHNQESWVQQ